MVAESAAHTVAAVAGWDSHTVAAGDGLLHISRLGEETDFSICAAELAVAGGVAAVHGAGPVGLKGEAGIAFSAHIDALAVHAVGDCAEFIRDDLGEATSEVEEGGSEGRGADCAELSAHALKTVLEVADTGSVVKFVSVQAGITSAVVGVADSAVCKGTSSCVVALA